VQQIYNDSKINDIKILDINWKIPGLQNDFFHDTRRCNFNKLKRYVIIVVKHCFVSLRYYDKHSKRIILE